jgi:large repetitive protein
MRTTRPKLRLPPCRVAAAALGLALACLIGTTSPALAAPPTLVITSPAQGTTTNDATPLFVGTTEQQYKDETGFDPVVITVYKGTIPSGEAVESQETPFFLGSSWYLEMKTPLAEGTYTAVASQRSIESTESTEPPLASAPVTFTVDTTPPKPTVASPIPGASTSSGSLVVSGSAGTATGDLSPITVQVYAGAAPEGTPVEAIEVPSSGGSWTGTVAGLALGSYTLRAQQSDSAGNIGFSAPVPFAVVAPPAPPPPTASFRWFPAMPTVGEPVSLVSSSTDTGSPITGFAWAVGPTDPFRAGQSVLATSFTTPGPHLVRLQVTDAAGRSGIVSETILVRHHTATMMQPFPIVRIAGRETRAGVRLTLLTVLAPVSSIATVQIRGTGLRTTSQSRVATAGARGHASGTLLMSFPRFARSLAAGTVLEIRVTKPGQIGKYTRFVPHRGKLPTRLDTCLSTSGQPMSCPST